LLTFRIRSMHPSMYPCGTTLRNQHTAHQAQRYISGFYSNILVSCETTISIVKRQRQKLRSLKDTRPSLVEFEASLKLIMHLLTNNCVRWCTSMSCNSWLEAECDKRAAHVLSHLVLCVSLHATQRLKRTQTTLFQLFYLWPSQSLVFPSLSPSTHTSFIHPSWDPSHKLWHNQTTR